MFSLEAKPGESIYVFAQRCLDVVRETGEQIEVDYYGVRLKIDERSNERSIYYQFKYKNMLRKEGGVSA
ncbi:MAG: hypothetical protein ACOCQR_02450 [bacterium]